MLIPQCQQRRGVQYDSASGKYLVDFNAILCGKQKPMKICKMGKTTD
jgi:hypothetical protein